MLVRVLGRHVVRALTGNVEERNLAALGGTTDQADGDGHVLESIGGSPLDGVGGAGVDLLVGSRLGDGVKVGVLSQDVGGEGQESSSGDGEAHCGRGVTFRFFVDSKVG